MDVHSCGNPELARIRHIRLDLTVDFEKRRLSGTAELELAAPLPAGGTLRLDTRDLEIESVESTGGAAPDSPAPHELGLRDPILGAPLSISLPAGASGVRIRYSTSPAASGLQWLLPEQTAGRQKPFLFSQAQAIHARSFVPCQDSPGVRVTFDAVIRTPSGIVAVMGAENRSDPNEKGIYRFHMPQPVPPYLIAIAAGDLAFRSTGPRTGVWAEPSMVEASAAEFADAELMIAVTEKLFGEYRWGRFDVLVLPPSFPFGGMENPRLTFATPTVLAGDKSLVSLVAHELAHSWSGNLVTNAAWADFWLNEGFTVYIERRIVEAIYGRPRSEMEWLLGRRDLSDAFADLADHPERTALRIDLTGHDPDDGMNKVPYEKGALFLRLLEETFGRDRFDAFLRAWFDGNAFQSRTTDDFQKFLEASLLQISNEAAVAGQIDLRKWFDGPGLPASAPLAKSDALVQAEFLARDWAAGKSTAANLPIRGWSFHETLHFLRSLPADISADRLAELDGAFGLTASGNSEIVSQWLLVAIRSGYHAADEKLRSFLVGMGRRKFLKPLYIELMKTDSGKAAARSIYAEARPRYHPIAQGTIDGIVGR